MTRYQATYFRSALQNKREELIRQIAEHSDRMAVEPTSDPMDQLRSVADRDLAVRNADRMNALLRLIEDALRAIGEGTYGICAHCGEDLPAKRLQAVPWSLFCISCQERAEQAQRNDEPLEFDNAYALAS